MTRFYLIPYPYVFLVIVCLEVICHGYLLPYLPSGTVSISYLLLGLTIGLFPFYASPGNDPRESQTLVWLGLLAFMTMSGIHFLRPHLAWQPLDYKVADMLPVIQIMGERWIEGVRVYEPIEEIWGGTKPIYLPAIWLGYLPSVVWDFDPRWITLASVLVSSFLISTLVFHHKNGLWTAAPLLLLTTSMLSIDTNLMVLSQEGIVIAYYLLLAYAIATEKIVLTGIAGALCLLSRYIMGPWFIMYVAYLFLYKSRKSGWRVLISCSVTVVLLMTIGRSWYALLDILSLPGHYLHAAIEDPEKYDDMIQNSMGVSKFFFPGQLPILHKLFLALSLAAPLALLGAARINSTWRAQPLFGLASLKICLVISYNFLVLPYPYLFYTSSFLSIALLMAYFHHGKSNEMG